MAKHFPLDVRVRSEERARFIRAGCPETPERLVKVERPDSGIGNRWDVYAQLDKLYDWGGLTPELSGLVPPRSYSPGV